jgi:aminoglycoside phosphotransferase family enzyme/predicted kinase
MDPLIASLLLPGAYPHPTGPITLRETHISWVLLTGPYAYKIKKPVSLGFVDFSQPEQRHHFCQEELRLNKRLAPEIYLDLVEIHGPVEQASLLGSGPVIEIAVRMQQFAEEGLLSRALGTSLVTGEQLERFAERLAWFHGDAGVADPGGPFGTPQAVRAPAISNLEVLRRIHPQEPILAGLQEWTLAEGQRLEAHFTQRLAQGRVREGHGDLHLDNLVVHQGEVLGFDCLEFNPSLRWIDVVSDVAFLAMDLLHRGETVLGGRVLNRWLITCGDYGALQLWAWYLSYRALVRAKVLALRREQLGPENTQQGAALEEQLWGYIHQAQRISGATRGGALILTHGVTGSGKSHLALQLCARQGWIHLRSDVERRRLFGRWGTTFYPPRQGDRYSPSVSEELYDALLPQAAEQILKAGFTAVVDATFLKRSQRRTFLTLAERLNVPAVILDCSVDLETARGRIAARAREGNDPSEADGTVLSEQWRIREPLNPGEEPVQLVGTEMEWLEEQLSHQLPGVFRTTPPPLPRRC